MSEIENPKTETGWWDLTAAFLVVACIFVATLRLMATQWTEDLSRIQTIAFFGVILGLALGKSIFSPRVCALFSIAYGVLIIPWQLGLTMEKGTEWVERLQSLRGRLSVILETLAAQESVSDNLLFILLMSVLFWILSNHAGYVVFREANPWKAILPTGLAIFVIHSFDPILTSRSWFLAFYLFFSLLLVARLVYLRKMNDWKKTRTHTPVDLGFDFSRIAVIATIFIVLLAWNIPVLAERFAPLSGAWAVVNKPWQYVKDKFDYVFASLQPSVGVVIEMYGDDLSLGTGTPLSDKVIMEVKAPDLDLGGARFYWRGRVYDTYADGEWNNSFFEKLSLSSDTLDLTVPGAEIRQSVELSVITYDSYTLIYSAAQPLWVSRPTMAEVTNNFDGTVDLGALVVTNYLRPGERYETRSSLSTVSIKDLREAGTDYPQWVLDRYLQIPDNITTRTYELAQQIASDEETPYDIAQAVTNYLRRNIEYKPVIIKPPASQERIDWFLFDLQQGYCNYYATAEVLLLRSLGIPARLAVGFAQGERVAPSEADQLSRIEAASPEELLVSFIVRQRDAHAWPEVYFPEIGWVEFEPTSSQDSLVRRSGEILASGIENQGDFRPRDFPIPLDEEPIPEAESSSGDALQPEKFWTVKSVFMIVLTLAVFALLILYIWSLRRGFKLKPALERLGVNIPIQLERSFLRLGISPPQFLSDWVNYLRVPVLSKAYNEINRALKRLGQPAKISETPSERVDRLGGLLPDVQNQAQDLLNEYQAAAYSLHPPNEDQAVKAGKEIKKKSINVVWRKWLERFQEPSTDSLGE